MWFKQYSVLQALQRSRQQPGAQQGRLGWERLGRVLTLALLLMAFFAVPAQAQQIDQVLVEESSDSINSQKVAVDGAGNRYVTGQFNGDVTFGEGANGQVINGTDDIFVAKYNVLGALVWVQVLESLPSGLGGAPIATSTGIDADVSTGGLYVAGTFGSSLEINSIDGTSTLISQDSTADGFIVRLNLVTGVVEWGNQIRGFKVVGVNDLDANPGAVAITGKFEGTAEFTGKFNTSKTLLAETVEGADMFLAQYSQVGQLTFALKAGGGTTGSRGAEGLSIRFATGQLGVTVVGEFFGTTRFIDHNNNIIQRTAVGGKDGFVAHYRSDGSLAVVHQIGSPNSESASSVIHNGIHIYVAGPFQNTLTIGATSLTSRGQIDNFLVKYNRITNSVDGVTQIGSENSDFVTDLATDFTTGSVPKNIYVTGRFLGAQLTMGTGSNAIQLPANGNTAYVASLNANLAPGFGQTVQGKFTPRRLVAESDGTLHLSGETRGAVTFGVGDQTIAIPAPTGTTGMAVAHFHPNGAPVSTKLLYVSSTGSGKVGGIAFDHKDMLAFDPATNKWSLLIDGSDIVPSDTDIDAFEWRSDQTMLMSFDVTTTLPVLGVVGDEDIVRFIPTSLGATTAGGFEMFLDGSTVGLNEGDENEDIDGITFTPEGQLVISTRGPANVRGANSILDTSGADLLRFESNRTWSIHLEGADLGLLPPGENGAALHLDADGVHLGITTTFDINGVNSQGQPITFSGDGNDIVTCLPESLGTEVRVSGCTLRFDGGANGLGALMIDNIAVGRSGMIGTAFSDDEANATPENPDGVGAVQIFLPIVNNE